MVLSEFMVMVSNDVPSTLGYSGSLKDGGPPGPASPPSARLRVHLPRGERRQSHEYTRPGAAGSGSVVKDKK